jgi:hypothetical protein
MEIPDSGWHYLMNGERSDARIERWTKIPICCATFGLSLVARGATDVCLPVCTDGAKDYIGAHWRSDGAHTIAAASGLRN